MNIFSVFRSPTKFELMLLIAQRTSLLCLLFVAFCPLITSAHPHVFVDCSLAFVFDEKGLAGIQQQWAFDEMFTEMILFDHDKNRDSVLSPAEITSIKKGAFDNLKESGFFTHVLIDGKKFSVKWVTDFSARVEENRLIYSFVVPCHVNATTQLRTIRVSVFDDEYYTDIALELNPLSYQGKKELFTIDCSRDFLPELTYYYGQVVPEGLFLKIKAS